MDATKVRTDMNTVNCPYCKKPARLVDGTVIYPHRDDLSELNFWQCAPCDAYVGCHKEGAWFFYRGEKQISDGTLPLGRLANAELRRAKSAAHAAFDPIWRSGGMSRKDAYSWLASKLKIKKDDCHIGMMNVEGCNAIVRIVNQRITK